MRPSSPVHEMLEMVERRLEQEWPRRRIILWDEVAGEFEARGPREDQFQKLAEKQAPAARNKRILAS